MIDKLFIRPFLALFTFVKRNPLLATVLIIILFLLPPLLYALSRVFYWTVGLVGRVLGLAVAARVGDVLGKLITWMQNRSYSCPAFALVIGFFSPLVGGLLTAWCIVDKFKTAPEVTALPLPDPPPSDEDTDVPPATGGTTIDDYFGGIWA